MKKLAFCGLMLVLVCGLGGCKSKHEALQDDAMAMLNELCDILDGVTDDASAQAAVPKIEKLGARMKELGERAKALGTPPKEEEERLKTKMTAYQEKLKKRMEAAGPKLERFPS